MQHQLDVREKLGVGDVRGKALQLLTLGPDDFHAGSDVFDVAGALSGRFGLRQSVAVGRWQRSSTGDGVAFAENGETTDDLLLYQFGKVDVFKHPGNGEDGSQCRNAACLVDSARVVNVKQHPVAVLVSNADRFGCFFLVADNGQHAARAFVGTVPVLRAASVGVAGHAEECVLLRRDGLDAVSLDHLQLATSSSQRHNVTVQQH